MPHELAEQAKASGNKLFSSGNYLQAISQYTRAINFDDTNHIYFSNRATCYLKIKRYNEARKDAERCISILPTFLKGYLRLGTALFYLGQYEEAIQHLETTLRIGREGGLTPDETTIVTKLLDSCTEYIREIGPVKVNIIEELPIEIIDTIFQYLDPHSVCTQFKELSTQEYLWEEHCHSTWIGKIETQFSALFNGAPKLHHWKEYYYKSLVDAKRIKITDKEFTKHKWEFEVKQHSYTQMRGEARFLADHTYDIGYGRVHAEHMKWEFADGGAQLVVNNFPPQFFYRTADWGWASQNDRAVMYQPQPVFKGVKR